MTDIIDTVKMALNDKGYIRHRKGVFMQDAELEQYGMIYASNVLQSLIDATCHNCSGKDVREAIIARKHRLDNEIKEIDGKIN